MGANEFPVALLDKGMEPNQVARLARELNHEQRQIVHDMLKKTWRLAGLFVFANAKKLLAGYQESCRIVDNFERDWKAQ